MLAIVWAVEYFRCYVYGVPFKIISDHKALETVLKGQKASKTYSSRLTRWVDQLLPFEFEVFHGPGRKLGIVDYLSRNPTSRTDIAKTLWNEWFTINVVSEIKNSKLANQQADRGANQPIKARTKQTRKRKARMRAERKTTPRHH